MDNTYYVLTLFWINFSKMFIFYAQAINYTSIFFNIKFKKSLHELIDKKLKVWFVLIKLKAVNAKYIVETKKSIKDITGTFDGNIFFSLKKINLPGEKCSKLWK